MHRVVRNTLIAAVAAGAAFALSACGSSTPATRFESGNFTVGEDIEAGTYTTGDKVTAAVGDWNCNWHIEDESGYEFANSHKTPVNRITLKDGWTVKGGFCVWHKVPSAAEQAEIDEAINGKPTTSAPATSEAAAPTTPAAAPAKAKSMISEPGTYTVGTDILAGVWGPASFTPATTDVTSIVLNGFPAQTYLPTDTDSGKLHVSFTSPMPTTGGAGDGYQRADGRWDYSLILSPGDTITLTGKLAMPLVNSADMSGKPVS